MEETDTHHASTYDDYPSLRNHHYLRSLTLSRQRPILLALNNRGARLRFRRGGIRSTWRRVPWDDIGFSDFRAI
jgi:hypothetical protein